MTTITTKTGFTINPNLPMRSNLCTYIKDNFGNTAMSTLTYISHSEPYQQHFKEKKCDIKVRDQFGEVYDICEDYIWQ